MPIDRNGQRVWLDSDTAKSREYSLGTAASSEKATGISLCTVFSLKAFNLNLFTCFGLSSLRFAIL